MSEKPQSTGLTIGRNMKMGLFHLGSGMADVLTTGVWNRMMISDLGFGATGVGFLLALRYFLSPLGIWAGRVSDKRVVAGYRRLFWVWLGRFMMVVSTVMLGAATAEFTRTPGQAESSGWIFAVVALLLFSIGSALSGGTFLSLIYDRAPETQRGRAVGIVWTFLLVGFTIGGIFFSIALPEHQGETTGLSFTPESVFNVFLLAGIVFAALWFFSLLGEEKRAASGLLEKTAPEKPASSLQDDLKLVWQHRTMRFFLLYLTLSMFFAFSQDAILEPWAGDVFAMPVKTTSRFTAYWGSMSILGTLLFLWLSRRYPRLTMTAMSYLGAGLLAVTFGVLTFSSLAEIRPLVTPALILLGLGLGIWNVGTLGLMMKLSPAGQAGTFLGFWTMAVTLARGGGVAAGGMMRDIGMQLSASFSVSYGIVFAAGAVGLLMSMWALSQARVNESQSVQPVEGETVLAGAMD